MLRRNNLIEEAYAFIASTLPISTLNQNIKNWGIKKIIVQNQFNEASYKYLQHRHPNLVLIILSDRFLLRFLHIFWILLCCKVYQRRIIFFHECCCPAFDILVKLLHPKGDYYPQVTLDSFDLLEPTERVESKLWVVFKYFGISRWFNVYKGDADGGIGKFILFSCLNYPKSIHKHKILRSNNFIELQPDSSYESRRVLFLCGKDVVSELELSHLIIRVIDVFVSEGWECYTKDHPAPSSRLNLIHSSATTIDPAMPIELIPLNFSVVVAIASTGLINSSKRAVSIIKLLPNIDQFARDRRIKHLKALPDGKKIFFCTHFSDLIKIAKH